MKQTDTIIAQGNETETINQRVYVPDRYTLCVTRVATEPEGNAQHKKNNKVQLNRTSKMRKNGE